eukprot:CFRG3574T1
MTDEDELAVGQWVRVRWENKVYYLGSVAASLNSDEKGTVVVKFSDGREVEVPRGDVYVVGGSQENDTSDFYGKLDADSGCQFRNESFLREDPKVEWKAGTTNRGINRDISLPMRLRSQTESNTGTKTHVSGLYPVQHSISRLHESLDSDYHSDSSSRFTSINKTEELMAAEVLSTLSNLSCDGGMADDTGMVRVNSEEEKPKAVSESPTNMGSKLRPLLIKNLAVERRAPNPRNIPVVKAPKGAVDVSGKKPMYCCVYQTCQKVLGTYAGMKKHITSVHNISQYVGRYMVKVTDKTAGQPLARIDRVPEDVNAGIKCRKRYGVDERDMWCAKCRWKKACERV